MSSKAQNESKDIRYAGFNIRLYANFIDIIVLAIVSYPLMMLTRNLSFYQAPPHIQQAIDDFSRQLITYPQLMDIVVPFMYLEWPHIVLRFVIDFVIIGVLFVGYWRWKNSTPGKDLLKLRIVDSKTFGDPTTTQYLLRFVGYIIATLPLCLGFLIIPFSKKKKGLHDLISGTAVIHLEPRDIEKEKKYFKYKMIFVLSVVLIFAIMVASK